MSEQADLLYCQNQDVVAVTPAQGGRLDKLVRWFVIPIGQPQVWIFSELWVHDRYEGDLILEFFHRRGVLSGSKDDAGLFLEMCRHEFGLMVRYDASLEVPFSGHQRRRGLDRDNRDMWDFTRKEYECVREDRPPTRDALMKLLAEAAGATASPPPA